MLCLTLIFDCTLFEVPEQADEGAQPNKCVCVCVEGGGGGLSMSRLVATTEGKTKCCLLILLLGYSFQIMGVGVHTLLRTREKCP